MPNEWDLQAAICGIAEADTGPNRLVQLLGGRPDPLVEWGDKGMGKRPVVALFLDVNRFGRGTGRQISGEIRLSALVDDSARGLESRMCDRLEAILTTPALAQHGIDAVFTWSGRSDLTDLTSSGRRRDLEGTFTITRT